MDNLMALIGQSLYFYLPAYFANMTPPVVAKLGILKFLDKPMDFDISLGGVRIFGDHKTWRGIVTGIIVGTFLFFVQVELFSIPFFRRISLFDYTEGGKVFLIGFLLSFGALFGDALFSFIKRRMGFEPGRSLILFDQTDHVIGAFALTSLLTPLDLKIWLTIFVITFFLHLLVNYAGFRLGITQSKF